MPTVQEILKQTGFSDDQIAALEPRAITAFNGVLSTAQQEREAAERARQANQELYEGQIAPALTGWDEEKTRMDNERANLEAQVAFYRTQNEAARQSGFIANDAPGYPARDQGGRYVPNVPGSTPGSPTFDVNQIYQRAGDAVGVLSDIQYEHQRLFNQPLPVPPSELVRRADAVKLDPRTYAARTFGWDARQAELEKQKQDAHDSQIKKDAAAERDRFWAEKVGSNPDVRMSLDSRYASNARAVKAGVLPDPLSLSEEQRRIATRQAIRTELAEQQNS